MRVTPVVRSLLSLASLFAVTLALLLGPATAASAAGEEGDFVARTNASRTAAGLAPLRIVGELATIARAQSERMGRENRLYHNPLLTTQVPNWQSVGENVGYGGSVTSIYDALYASPGHRANMLSTTFTEVGIGTWLAPTGRLWVTQVFRKPLIATSSLAPVVNGFPVIGAIATTVNAFGGLGDPVTPEFAVPGGVEQDFRGGDVLWSPQTDARVVQGMIRERYRSLSGPRSPLGLPVTHELPTPNRNGRYNHFQAGSVYWSPATGAQEVRGAIRGVWGSLGWENSTLGFPVTGELPTPNNTGRYNHFQAGSVYWSPATGAREVRGAIRQRWAAMGWELGPLGYPTSNEYAVPGGRRTDFQRGSIVWDAQTGATNIV